MLPLVRLLDGQGTVVIRSSEATDGVGHDAQHLTRKSTEVAGTSLACDVCSGRERFRLAQVKLPPADVPPLAVLEADVLVDAHRLEPERFVDSDARFIRERDPGDQEAVAVALQAVEQVRVKTATNTGPLRGLVDIRADLDSPVVRRTVAVPASIRVAEDLAVDLRDEPDVGLADPVRHLVRGRRLRLERDRALGYVRLVDRGAGRGVLLGI